MKLIEFLATDVTFQVGLFQEQEAAIRGTSLIAGGGRRLQGTSLDTTGRQVPTARRAGLPALFRIIPSQSLRPAFVGRKLRQRLL